MNSHPKKNNHNGELTPSQKVKQRYEAKYCKITIRLSLTTETMLELLAQQHGGITQAVEHAIHLAYNQLQQ